MRSELKNGFANITIKNGRVIDPKNGLDAQADVYVFNGRIVAIGAPPAHFTAHRLIDAQGRFVSPECVALSACIGWISLLSSPLFV